MAEANSIGARVPAASKVCRKCNVCLPANMFYLEPRMRDGLHSYCKPCHVALSVQGNRLRAEANREARRAEVQSRRAARKAASAATAAARLEHRRAVKRAYMAKRRQERPDEFNQWRTANLDRCAQRQRVRKAGEKRATPAWADEFLITEAYELARLRTRLFGMAWEVDHIYPLRGETVCGLHVIENLQVIPKRVNSRKINRHLDGAVIPWSAFFDERWQTAGRIP